MNRFSDFGIKTTDDSTIFQVPVTSITDFINMEVEVLDYVNGVTTQHGTDRCVVKIKHDGKEQKFFTTAKSIITALDKIDKDKFPFTATIRQQKYGGSKNRSFHFE